MNSHRHDPDSEQNTSDTRDNERAVFAAQMTAQPRNIDHEFTEELFQRWQDLPELERSLLAGYELSHAFGRHQAELDSTRDGVRDEALLFFRRMERRLRDIEAFSKRRTEVVS